MRQRPYFQMIECRLLAALLATASPVIAQPAFAQDALDGWTRDMVVGTGTGTKSVISSEQSFRPGGGPGLIIISRDVGPRNALTPEVGRADPVRVAPEELYTVFNGTFDALTDSQVAEINSGTGATSATQSAIQAPLEMLAGNDNIRSESAGGIGGAGGVGGIVSDAIGQGMGALASALSGLNQ